MESKQRTDRSQELSMDRLIAVSRSLLGLPQTRCLQLSLKGMYWYLLCEPETFMEVINDPELGSRTR